MEQWLFFNTASERIDNYRFFWGYSKKCRLFWAVWFSAGGKLFHIGFLSRISIKQAPL